MSDADWFYVESGNRHGPVTTQELAQLLQTKLPPETMVWHQGFAAWMQADQLPEFSAQIPPPLPAQIPTGPPLVQPSEEPTLNPFRLFRRCFSWKGRFTRAEFAVAFLGNYLLVWAAAFGLGIIGSIAGANDKTLEGIGSLLALVWLPFGIGVSLGSGVRRLHDLGKPGWWLVLAFMPCVNLIMILYLLFGQSSPDAQVKDSTSSIVVAVAAGFVAIMFIGIIAAIAIPSLLRARVSANESATIGDIRTVIMAEAAYQAANKGFYDQPSCLAAPATCIPGYQGPSFLDPQLAALQPKAGYERTFHAQPAPFGLPPGASPSGLVSFAVVAVPVAQDKTGVRGFCGDATGRLCATSDGSPPPVVDGLCGVCITLK